MEPCSSEKSNEVKEEIDGYVWSRHVIPYEKWREEVVSFMTQCGWKLDVDSEDTLGFSLKDGDHLWIRDYCKKMRRFCQYDGNQKINLVCTKDKYE